jgi:hypothetical protein
VVRRTSKSCPPARNWRWKHRYAGNVKRLALGVFPEVPLLAEATDLRDKARAALREGRDPAAERRERKLAVRAATGAASRSSRTNGCQSRRTWLRRRSTRAKWELEVHAFPWIGKRAVAEITASELLSTLRRVEGRGKLETAQRVKQRHGQIFRYAVATDRAERDPIADLRGALAAREWRMACERCGKGALRARGKVLDIRVPPRTPENEGITVLAKHVARTDR